MANNEKKIDAILLIGPPGVGKGTQGKLLGAVPGFLHVASGDIFRGLDRESELGKTFLEYSSKGLLVPDDLTIKMWYEFMKSGMADGSYRPDEHMVVLDGIPRNKNQAEMMDQYLTVHKVVRLVVEHQDELLRRMKRRAEHEGRHDDAKEEVILNRFEIYKNETFPMLKHYDRDDLIAEINAIGSPGRVLRDVLSAIVPAQEAVFENALE